MTSLEQKIRPGPSDHPWLRELLGASLLIVLTAVLLAGWGSDEQRHFKDVVAQMYSFRLLPALGFALALRCGAIDLSVWSVTALGGVAAAVAARSGLAPAAVLLAGMTAGLLMGALHAALTAGLRAPSPAVTLVSGVAVFLALSLSFQGPAVAAPEGVFSRWIELVPAGLPGGPLPWSNRPPFVLSMALVSLACLAVGAVVLAGALVGYPGPRRQRWTLAASLCASGALAGLAGAIWLAEHGSAPIPVRPIEDLRIPAAALLSGAVLFAGSGRTLLVVLAIAPALLAATIWQAQVAHLAAMGVQLQTAVLIGMTIVAHLAIIHADRAWRSGAVLSAVAVAATLGAMVVLAFAAMSTDPAGRLFRQATGLAGCLAGAVVLLIAKGLHRLRLDQPSPIPPGSVP